MTTTELTITTDPTVVTPSEEQDPPKKNMLPWKIVCLVLVLLVSLGWIGIITLLIMKEEWQLVLVAWLLLYAAVHFCYWYCRRNSSRTISTQIRDRLVSRLRGTDPEAYASDCPPSYDELVKSDGPPPAYYSVVQGTPKLKRFLKGEALPWFLKKKTLEAESSKASSSGDVTMVTAPAGSSVVTIEDEEAFELPSYDSLMRQNMQPVMTPIHQALAGLPCPTRP